jgi:hypothetical protein
MQSTKQITLAFCTCRYIVATRNQELLMSLEQALIEWIINTLQPFVVVEKPFFQQIFECIQHELPLRTRDTI